MQQLKQTVKGLISAKRFDHTLSVCEKATQLAKHYNLDHDKAYLAALIHDAAKEYSPNKCKQEGIVLADYSVPIFENYKSIWHALIIDQFGPAVLGVSDQDILHAAKWHTTGHSQMSELAKVIFVADYIDPLRQYSDQAAIEAVALQSLDDAMLVILIKTIQFLLKKQATIYEATIDCYNTVLLKSGLDKNIIDELIKL